jgi:hypothetical protein
VDVEEEILHLKKRIQAREEMFAGGDKDPAAPSEPVPSGAATPDIRRELAEWLEALGVEITGLRWQAKEYHATGVTQVLKRLDDLRIGVHELGLRIDEVLKRNT